MKKTCLIIEDELPFAKILESVINKIDEIELIGLCDNTVDAVRKIEREKPQILLLDVNISGLEGPEILELTDHQPKTIVISSHPEDVMRSYDICYSGYIQKPLKNAEQLTNELKKVLAEF